MDSISDAPLTQDFAENSNISSSFDTSTSDDLFLTDDTQTELLADSLDDPCSTPNPAGKRRLGRRSDLGTSKGMDYPGSPDFGIKLGSTASRLTETDRTYCPTTSREILSFFVCSSPDPNNVVGVPPSVTLLKSSRSK